MLDPDQGPVHDDPHIRGEQAVIIWDDACHIEHFIRQADIDTKSPVLAFLVPTPAPPEIADADPRIFDLADAVAHAATNPNYVNYNPLEVVGAFLTPVSINWTEAFFGSRAAPVATRTPIVNQAHLGGYKATVLDAANGPAMQAWLLDHGFRMTAATAAWLRPYVAAKWSITAFQLTRKSPESAAGLTTAAIRMSFPTDRPFYPYSEPARALPLGRANDERALSVALLSNEKVQGALAEGIAWPAEVQYAGSSDAGVAHAQPDGKRWDNRDWMKLVNLKGSVAHPRHLTYFRDLSNPRPGKTDLFFSSSKDQSDLRQSWTDYRHSVERMNLANPGSDLLALLVLGLCVGAPIYCGKRVYDRANDDVVGEGTRTDRFMAGSAIALGAWELLTLDWLTVGAIGSLNDIGQLPVVLMGSALLAIAWCILSCGRSIWRDVSVVPRPLRSRVYGLGSFMGGMLVLVVSIFFVARLI